MSQTQKQEEEFEKMLRQLEEEEKAKQEKKKKKKKSSTSPKSSKPSKAESEQLLFPDDRIEELKEDKEHYKNKTRELEDEIVELKSDSKLAEKLEDDNEHLKNKIRENEDELVELKSDSKLAEKLELTLAEALTEKVNLQLKIKLLEAQLKSELSIEKPIKVIKDLSEITPDNGELLEVHQELTSAFVPRSPEINNIKLERVIERLYDEFHDELDVKVLEYKVEGSFENPDKLKGYEEELEEAKAIEEEYKKKKRKVKIAGVKLNELSEQQIFFNRFRHCFQIFKKEFDIERLKDYLVLEANKKGANKDARFLAYRAWNLKYGAMKKNTPSKTSDQATLKKFLPHILKIFEDYTNFLFTIINENVNVVMDEGTVAELDPRTVKSMTTLVSDKLLELMEEISGTEA